MRNDTPHELDFFSGTTQHFITEITAIILPQSDETLLNSNKIMVPVKIPNTFCECVSYSTCFQQTLKAAITLKRDGLGHYRGKL